MISLFIFFLLLDFYYAFPLVVSSEDSIKRFLGLKPLTANVLHHIETSQLIWIANQLTGFYMMGNIGR